MSFTGVGEHFSEYFDVRLANTDDLLRQVYRIRYDVYCREFGYEREENCPGGLERDEYDEFSVHCLILHRQSGIGAGCIRIVVPPVARPDFLLPIERFCGDSLSHPDLHPSSLPRGRVVELSRLAVHTQFRRRQGESESPVGRLAVGELTEDEKRTFPLVALALFSAGLSLTRLSARHDGFVMMERRLARRLQATGFPFVQVGEPLEYHGIRAPYHSTVDRIQESMPEMLRPLFEFVDHSLERDFRVG